MSEENLKKIKTEIIKLAAFFEHVLSDEQIVMYSGFVLDSIFVEEFSPAATIFVKNFTATRPASEKFATTLSRIIQIARPPIDTGAEAATIAARMVGAVRKFGHTNPDRAKEFVGPDAWEIIDDLGGWTGFCSRLTNENQSYTQTMLAKTLASRLDKTKVDGELRQIRSKVNPQLIQNDDKFLLD